MAMKYRKPGQTTPTRSFPLVPPDEGGAVGRWMGYLAILCGIVLAIVAWLVPVLIVQVTSLLLLAGLLGVVAVMSVRTLQAVIAPRGLPVSLWTLLAGTLVVAVALGAVLVLTVR